MSQEEEELMDAEGRIYPLHDGKAEAMRDCKHGRKAGKCEICDLIAERDAANRRAMAAEAQVAEAVRECTEIAETNSRTLTGKGIGVAIRDRLPEYFKEKP